MADETTQVSGDKRPFIELLDEAISDRRGFLERAEIPALKEEFKKFHAGLSSVYAFFVSKGYVTEDPYKNDMKTDEITLPENTPITDNNRRDQIGRRLSHLDNQFDHICNFFRMTTDSLTQERVKQIMALIRFVEWNRLTPDSKSVTTVAIASLVTMARKSSMDAATAGKFNEALAALGGGTETIFNKLKLISDFNREQYKYEVRSRVMPKVSQADAHAGGIKAAFESVMPGTPFYKELIEEIIREDAAKDGQTYRAELLKKLTQKTDAKQAAQNQKKTVALKPILIQGLNVISAANTILTEILRKLTENHDLMQAKKKGIFEAISTIFAKIMKKDTEAVIYTFEVFDPVRNRIQKMDLNFNTFTKETEKKARIFAAMAPRGSAAGKLDAMDENQLISLLKKNLRDILTFQKLFSGLDDFFKNGIDKDARSKVKGIKPELSELKNVHAQASQKLVDYDVAKEGEEQFKKMGIKTA